MKKRILSVLLCLVMVLGLLPTAAFAAGTTSDMPTEIFGCKPGEGKFKLLSIYRIESYSSLEEAKAASAVCYYDKDYTFHVLQQSLADMIGKWKTMGDYCGADADEDWKNVKIVFHTDFTTSRTLCFKGNAEIELKDGITLTLGTEELAEYATGGAYYRYWNDPDGPQGQKYLLRSDESLTISGDGTIYVDYKETNTNCVWTANSSGGYNPSNIMYSVTAISGAQTVKILGNVSIDISMENRIKEGGTVPTGTRSITPNHLTTSGGELILARAYNGILKGISGHYVTVDTTGYVKIDLEKASYQGQAISCLYDNTFKPNNASYIELVTRCNGLDFSKYPQYATNGYGSIINRSEWSQYWLDFHFKNDKSNWDIAFETTDSGDTLKKLNGSMRTSAKFTRDGVSGATLTPQGGDAISSSGKATITPGTKTFTITADAADWLKTLVTEGRAEYAMSALIFKNGEPQWTKYTVTPGFNADGTPNIELELKEAPKAGDVYSIAVFVTPVAKGTKNPLCADAYGSWTLTTEAAPPEPVRHQIQISNGTIEVNGKPDLWAYAGDTVTVRATDRTSDNMMFTQWYTNTSGVTFTDVSKQTTTFVMPDCNVGVWPGFHGVEFTKQPAKTYWTQAGYGQTLTAAFSYPITEWELREGSKMVAFGGPISANEDFTVTVPEQNTNASKTYTIVVTANGQEFSSNEFTVNWDVLGKAPPVEFDPIDGRQFVEALDVTLAPAYGTYRLRYTLDGTDPKDREVDDVNVFESAWGTSVTLKSTTTITARTYDSTAVAEASKWGPLSTATFYYVSTLPTPKIIPGDMTYTDPFTVYLSAPYLHDVSMEYQIVPQGETVDDDYGWTTYDRENDITVNEWGTVTLYARTFKYVERQQDGKWYTDRMTSEKAAATYSRSYTAEIEDVTVNGKVGEELSQDVVIRMSREKFKGVAAGTDVSAWFNLPDGLTATVKEINATNTVLTVTISGTPKAASAAAITVTIPKDNLTYNTAEDLNVLSNPKAVYAISNTAHTHSYGSWTDIDDDKEHIKSCSNPGCDQPVLFEAHSFDAWTQDASDDTRHYRECSDCGHKVYAAHNESSHITDTPAGIGTPGTWHTECVYCGKRMSEGTLEALTKIDVANLTAAKPVKDAACADASTTDDTYYVAYTEWMDQNGDPLTIGESFQPGTVYTVKITLEGKDNNVFSASSSYNTIEGKTATVSPALTGDAYAYSVVLTYTFDATEGTYVPTKPAITTATLPDGKVGEAYTALLEATGDKPITWSIETGALPDGLTLNSANGTISGTPSKAGSVTFTVKASNTAGDATKEFTVTIADTGAVKYHNVTLSGAGTGATGAGSHATGTTVNIYAGTKSGYTFAGWTSDDVTVLSASSTSASFVMPDKDVTVKANWTYNGSSGGGGYTYYTIKATAGVNGSISPSGNVSVREGRDQTFTITPDKGYAVARVLVDSKNVGAVKSYTFENVKKAHTIEVVFMKSSGNPQTGVFVDVPEGSYYEEAVNWAVEQGITTGTDATHFTPDGICTRAQAVTFLWRAAGSPAPKTATMPFTDVKSGAYYYDAVLWAVENGITKGTSATEFSPDLNCSRAQIVTFLWRSEKSPAAGTVNPFTDVKSDAYYADAVLWAVKEDVTKGTTDTTFSPDANCTRAQIVTFIWRALAE